LVIKQAFIQLVSTIIKETSISDDEDLTEGLSLKIIKSIYYHYLLKRSVAEIARLIKKTEIREFAKGSISHIVFTNLKKAEKKD